MTIQIMLFEPRTPQPCINSQRSNVMQSCKRTVPGKSPALNRLESHSGLSCLRCHAGKAPLILAKAWRRPMSWNLPCRPSGKSCHRNTYGELHQALLTAYNGGHFEQLQ